MHNMNRGSLALLASAASLLGGGLASLPAGNSPMAAEAPTYAGQVAAILNKNCVECHRPGEIAPFSLEGYENAKKWCRMVANVTERRVMPPWKAVEGYGDFQDAKRLTPRQIEILKAWAAADAPRGDRTKEPPTPTFPSGWTLGKPDLILQPSKPFRLPSEGTDLYRNFVIKNEFPQTRWITAIDVRPGNKRVVHHVIVFTDNLGLSQRIEAQNHDGQEGYSRFGGIGFPPSGSLGGWAPGLRPHFTPKGVAFKVNAGATLVLQVHYHLTGKPETDQTRVALYFAKEPVAKEMKLAWDFGNIDIPPGDKHYHAVFDSRLSVPVTLYSVMPHMHLLGKSMKAMATLPDGKVIPLVYVDQWDFNWQMNYVLKKPLHLPAGTKIHIDAIYDNSADNPRNPNSPPKRVTFGERTSDEMFLLIAAYTADQPGTELQDAGP